LVQEKFRDVVPLPQILLLIFWVNMRSWGFAFPSGFPVLFFLQKFFVGGFRSDIRFVGPCDGWVERGEHRAFLRWGGFEALIILITTIEHFSIFHNYNYLAVFATRSF